MSTIKSGEWGGIPVGATLLSWSYEVDGSIHHRFYSRLLYRREITPNNYSVTIRAVTPDECHEEWCGYRLGSHFGFNSEPCDWMFHSVVSADGNPGLAARREQRTNRRYR